MTKEPEYLYAVVDVFDKPVVERAQVAKRTKRGVWFVDRPRASSYRCAMTHEAAKRHFSATPAEAIEKWRDSAKKYVEHREEEIQRMRVLLDGPDPKNVWEEK